MGRSTRTWSLHIDESGDQWDPNNSPTVAAVLCDTAARVWDDGEIRRAIETTAPGIPWPPHAWLVSIPVAHAVWARRSMPGRASAVALRAADALEVASPEMFRAVVARPSDPERYELRDLHLALDKSSPSLARDLRHHRDRVATDLHGLFDLIGKLRPVKLVAATDSVPGAPAASHLCPGLEPRSYVVNLVALLRRTIFALARLGGDHRVDVHALTLGVLDPVLETQVRLTPGVLGQLCSAASGPERRESGPGWSVVLNPGFIGTWNREVAAAFVLADFAANRARLQLAAHAAPHAVVRARVEAATGLMAGFDPLRGAHLAASGVAHDHVEAARSTTDLLPALTAVGACRRWACEQAEDWAALVRGGAL